MQKYNIQSILLIIIIISISACGIKRQFTSKIIVPSPKQLGYTPVAISPCRDHLAHIPNLDKLDRTPIKYLRVNFHIMRRADGSGNFSDEEGKSQILEVLAKANKMLANNKKMNLPVGNNIPVLPTRIRYVLTPDPNDPDDDGIYFHNDEENYFLIGKGKHVNNYKKDIYNKYGIQKGEVLNVFVMGYHADSLQSKTYHPRVRGIGFGNWCKVSTWYHQFKPETQKAYKAKFSKYDINYSHTNLNHEIGHVLGLRHAWTRNDGCDDTPQHRNCWGQGAPPCDGPISNNVMDYSATPQGWTPCQIAKMHYNLARKKRPVRKLLIPKWCQLDESKTIHIKGDEVWEGAKDLEGNLVIENGASLTIRCRVSFPKGGKLIVKPKAKLILDRAILENTCNEKWLGIEKWKKNKVEGTVLCLTTTAINHCINNISLKEDESKE